MHGASRTGRTHYVEPAALVAPTNEFRAATGAVRAEEAAALRACGTALARHSDVLKAALAATGALDACRARQRFGEAVGGALPEVTEEPLLEVREARHASSGLEQQMLQR